MVMHYLNISRVVAIFSKNPNGCPVNLGAVYRHEGLQQLLNDHGPQRIELGHRFPDKDEHVLGSQLVGVAEELH